MKIRGSVFLFIAIAVVLIALMLWYGKRKPVEISPIASAETNTTPSATPSLPVSVSAQANMPTPSPVTGTNAIQAPPLSKWEQMQQVLSAYNDEPIAFYGRLEDQFGNPVTSAQIAASIRIENGIQHTVDRFSVTSDENGFFTITGHKGQDLGIVPEKSGYVSATTGTYFKYSHMEQGYYVPDKNNPAVIKMWKLQGAEPLVNINQRYKFYYTNAPISFDLLTGQIVPTGGDIKITVSRPEGDISAQNRQDWNVLVEAVDGGLMDSSGQDNVTYAAPESGYEPSAALSFSVGDRTWSEMFNRGFFVQSRNGQMYSKLGIFFRINSAPDDFIYVNFSGVANTNSSRNWEATTPQ